MKKVIVYGYFEKNLGDDLFLKILCDRYANTNFYFYSPMSYNTKSFINNNVKQITKYDILYNIKRLLNFISRKAKINKFYNIEDFIKFDYKVLICGSAFMEQEDYVKDNYVLNKYIGKLPFYIIGTNFGPYKTKKFVEDYKKMVFSKAKDICFRDKKSYDLFKELKNVRYSPDVVFSLDTKDIIITESNKVIISVINCQKDGMNISQNLYNKKIEEIIKYFDKLNYNICLMSFSKEQGDEEIINDIISNSSCKKIDKYFYRGNIEESLNIIASSKIVIGTRFHANILGMLFNKTVIPIAYSDKTINVLNDIGFDGKIFDIRDFEKFNISNLSEKDINYKVDVKKTIIDSQKQFEALDKILLEKINE